MRVWICDAAKDENGWDGYEGSIPGNQFKQTGNPKYPDECRCILMSEMGDFWWKNRNTLVFRCRDAELAEAIAIRMRQLVDNPHVGYSQPNRKGVYEKLMKNPDPSKISVDVEGDCSSCMNSVVYVTFKSVKHPELKKIKPLARTIDMPAMYNAIDEFEEVTAQVDLATGKGLLRGDILVIPNSHTACVWDVLEDYAEPEVMIPKVSMLEAKTDCYLHTEPNSKKETRCNIQMSPSEPIRNFLKKGERAEIISQNGNWCQVKIVGVYTWYPWVTGLPQYVKIITE